MTAILFVDTNVLLHYTFFDQVDWRTVVSADEAIVTICPAVLHELDKLKFSGGSKKIRERATRVVKRIGELLTDDRPVFLRQGCQLWALLCEPSIDYAANGLDKSVTDDQILASVMKRPHVEGEVFIVTADGSLRLKANRHSIRTCVPPDEWRSPEELDETERRLKQALQKIAELEAAAPRLSLTFRDGRTFGEFHVYPRPEPTAEEIKTKVERLRKKYPKLDTSEDPFGFSMGSMVTPSPREYNGALETYFARYAEYVKDTPRIYERRDRTIHVDLSLENNGTRSAEDVDIILIADADGEWRGLLHPVELAPSAPSLPRSILEPKYGDLAFLRPLTRIGQRTAQNASGPTLCKDDPGEVRFHVDRVKAGMSVHLPRVHFEFRSFDSATSFEVQWTMAAQNIAKPEEGRIHVRVEDRN